ncbi:MAG: gamma-glutamyl-gamma-aminobutyrate hydrolase family protein [Chloroflexota bacterium]|nr:MAG: gamma-glutamyl-gamma-aminobutyrate hydrolase family protein [Chloroflexota bacterium]
MALPVIGVTTMRRVNQYGMRLSSLAEAYIEALLQAGATPLLIPNLLPGEAIKDLLSRLDGVLFTGGGDIQGSYYQAAEHPKVNGVEADRDMLELQILERVIEDGKPFMGICRGLQLINVGLGGTLYADIAEQAPGAAKHDYYPDWDRDYLAHAIELIPGTRLAGILGNGIVEVNSLHHQGIRDLAPKLVPAAHSPDGIVEAVELPGHPYALAVQWHPEWLTAHGGMRTLFKDFVGAASRYQRDNWNEAGWMGS